MFAASLKVVVSDLTIALLYMQQPIFIDLISYLIYKSSLWKKESKKIKLNNKKKKKNPTHDKEIDR